jgi:oxygen-independent coproporphyrinogen-3 oxidase
LNEDIKLALEIAPPHISTYIMTVDGKNVFNVLKQDNKLKELDDEVIARYFLCVHDQLTQYGYEHYEISNFAKNDMFAKHNSNYWRNTIPYLGIGPSASSYNIFSRQTNIANNQVYVDNIQRNIIPMTIEYLTAEQQLNEYIINNLRTSRGLDIIELYNNFKYKIAPQYIELLRTNNLVQQQEGKIKLTPRGMLISNQIIINLIKDY